MVHTVGSPEMAELIEKQGLIGPADYSNLTENLVVGWAPPNQREIIDMVFLTDTKPTDQAGVNRDNALHGFPLRDAVQPLTINLVPPAVRNLHPGVVNFVRVPPENLQAVLNWNRAAKNKAMPKMIQVTEKVVSGTITEEAGIREISELLANNASIRLVNGAGQNEILKGLAKNAIDVQKRWGKINTFLWKYSREKTA